ncbi:hypothetical protein KUTeg_023916 [Tegillarca granosa]|uniref:Alpha-carbonic anhydrase domain-containing protein n=1 Tax=Tegillarca granosa TaxID=220873 RepID=A0ABQ9E1M8_TEGGR|nr:hypothetical protein KUTeg_023916 [Tegillarca granosa]
MLALLSSWGVESEEQVPVKELYVRSLIPSSPNFMTYEGSLTYPGCYETVTWIIMNRPIFVSNDQMQSFRMLRISGPENPQTLMADNVRPAKPLNRRTDKGCTMKKNMNYKGGIPLKLI